MKKTDKKLSLKRDQIKKLSSDSLAVAAGGKGDGPSSFYPG